MKKREIGALSAGMLLLLASCGGGPAVDAEAKDGARPPVERLPTLASLLKREIPAHFRRAHLGEVLHELGQRVGLESAFPGPIDGTFSFDLEGRRLPVGELLEELAKAGGLQLEFRGRTAVFWKPADDDHLVTLRKKIESEPPARGRCKALVELAQLGDPRIYPVLFAAMAGGSEAMALAAARQLNEHHSGTLRFAADHHAFAIGMKRLLSIRPENERQGLMGLAAASGSPHCGQLLLPFLEGERLQAYAVQCIGETRDQRTVGALLALYESAKPFDPNDDTGVAPASREQIIATLGGIGGPRAVEALAKMAGAAADREARLDCASALFATGDERGLEILLDLLAKSGAVNDDDDGAAQGVGDPGGGAPGPPLPFRAYVVHALSKNRDARALEPIIGVLDDPRSEVRREAILALGDLRDPRATEPLIRMLDDPGLQKVAIEALTKIGDPRAIEPVGGLTEQVDDLAVRHAAALHLLYAGDPRAEAAVWRSLEGFDPRYHLHAIGLLAERGDRKAVNQLAEWLNPDGGRRARDAADTLALVRDPSVIPALADALRNPDVNASFAAAAAIGAMRHPKALAQAAELLESADAPTREWGARILGWTKDPKATGALLAALEDEVPAVRQHAASALAEIGDARSLRGSISVLDDPDSDVRRYTAQSLGGTADPAVVEALLELLGDGDSFVREAAAKALLATGHPKALRRLALAANDSSSDGPGRAAYRALRPPGNFAWAHRARACAIDGLILLLDDRDDGARARAAAALALIADPCAIPPLIGALRDPSAGVRAAAGEALRSYQEDPRVKAALARFVE